MSPAQTDEMKKMTVIQKVRETADGLFTAQSTVAEIGAKPVFADFGSLLFPVDRQVRGDMTLAEVSSSKVYVWYSHIHPETTVDVVNALKQSAEAGKQVFYHIYTAEERRLNPDKENTGIFFFRGQSGARFAVMNAGGGFMYVGAMHDSFPQALEISRRGYNAFALIYRPREAYEDLARAIAYIHDHAEELGVNPQGYSLWGGSAGARMAAVLARKDAMSDFGRPDIEPAATVIMQYTGYDSVSRRDAPTYVCVGKSDYIADWRDMRMRLERLSALGIPTEFHAYFGLPHGFGLGLGTVAEGWWLDAISFWERVVME